MKDELIRRAKRGNRAALTELCKESAKSILFRVKRFISNNSDAEDVTQEVLVRMCERIHALREPRAFEAWLNSIIINEVRRYTKHNSQLSNVLCIDDYLESIIEEETELLPLEYVLTKEDSKAILAIIDLLPLRQREAVLLHYYRDLSVSVTAEVMGVTQPGVSLYLKLAREKIKSALLEQERLEQEQAPERRGSVAFGALAALPMGPLLSETLSLEAVQVGALGDALVTQALAKAAVASSSKQPQLIAAVAAALLATLITASSVYVFAGVPADSSAVPEAAQPERQVVFTGGGGDAYGHINPVAATVEESDNGSALQVRAWKITEVSENTVIYSGESSVAEEPFTQLPEGAYLITFTLTDEEGREYTSYGNFEIIK